MIPKPLTKKDWDNARGSTEGLGMVLCAVEWLNARRLKRLSYHRVHAGKEVVCFNKSDWEEAFNIK